MQESKTKEWPEKSSALHLAATHGHGDGVVALLRGGAAAGLTDKRGRPATLTPLGRKLLGADDWD